MDAIDRAAYRLPFADAQAPPRHSGRRGRADEVAQDVPRRLEEPRAIRVGLRPDHRPFRRARPNAGAPAVSARASVRSRPARRRRADPRSTVPPRTWLAGQKAPPSLAGASGARLKAARTMRMRRASDAAARLLQGGRDVGRPAPSPRQVRRRSSAARVAPDRDASRRSARPGRRLVRISTPAIARERARQRRSETAVAAAAAVARRTYDQAFSTIDRALFALERNASPKIVADWVALHI